MILNERLLTACKVLDIVEIYYYIVYSAILQMVLKNYTSDTTKIYFLVHTMVKKLKAYVIDVTCFVDISTCYVDLLYHQLKLYPVILFQVLS